MAAINSGILENLGIKDEPFIADSILGQLLYNLANEGLIPKFRESATAKGVVATKRLRSSLAPKTPVETPQDVTVTIVGEDYWEYADRGRRAGKMPPVKSIEEWITAKGIQVRRSKSQSGQSVMAARRSMAFGIARSIAQKGTIKRFGYKGSNFVGEVLSSRQMKLVAEYFAEQTGKQLLIYVSNDTSTAR